MIKCNIIIIIFSAVAALADGSKAPKVDELTAAYQREILFLSTYKKELESKTQSVKNQLGRKLVEAEKQLKSMENQWLKLQTNNDLKIQKLAEIERDYENKTENRALLQTTIRQAHLSEKKTTAGAIQKEQPLLQQIDSIYTKAIAKLKSSGSIQVESGRFFEKSGEETTGELIALGSLARFARKGKRVASLYPAGGGAFRVWSWLDEGGEQLIKGQLPATLQLFLYENPDKEFVAQKEKTVMDVMKAGGLIGWIIVALGLFALMISVIRFRLLQQAEVKNKLVISKVIGLIKEGEIQKAQQTLLLENNAISRVLGKTLGYLTTEPHKVEDAIQESILKESQTVDRFGVVILVIASVAPLMGLLGTVTGMISTFDIITLYGTGNPKLLSGGISEALVTTMFGLIVAIPALLIGQFLNSKTEGIKSDMEKWALATCNAFNNKKD